MNYKCKGTNEKIFTYTAFPSNRLHIVPAGSPVHAVLRQSVVPVAFVCRGHTGAQGGDQLPQPVELCAGHIPNGERYVRP